MPDSVAQLVGARVKYYRDLRELKQVELARLAEMSPPTLHRIERGEQNFTLAMLVALSEALGVPMRAFFTTMEPSEDPTMALIVRVLHDVSLSDRSDVLFLLGTLLEGKANADAADLLRRASGLRRVEQPVT